MSKTDLSGVWGFKGTSQLAKLTELQGYREKSPKNSKPPTPPCTEPLERYVSSVLVAALHRDGNIHLCPQHTQRIPSNSCEPRYIHRGHVNQADAGSKMTIWVSWADPHQIMRIRIRQKRFEILKVHIKLFRLRQQFSFVRRPERGRLGA
jgi:hypothetical protein